MSSGIYPTDAAPQVEYLMQDSDSVYLFVEDEEQLDKALGVRQRLPALRRIIVWEMEGLRDLEDPQVISLQRLREIGCARIARLGSAAADEQWQARIKSRQPEDLAILIYTSGTTGLHPKGAMLSHHNVLSTQCAANNTLIAQDETDEPTAFLPLCHVAERLGGADFAMYTGTKLNFVENPETIPEKCSRNRADCVPRRAADLGEVLLGCARSRCRRQPPSNKSVIGWPLASACSWSAATRQGCRSV